MNDKIAHLKADVKKKKKKKKKKKQGTNKRDFSVMDKKAKRVIPFESNRKGKKN